MSPTETLARWGERLGGEGFPTRLVRAGEEGVPYDVLLAGVAGEGREAPLQMELSFVPGMEEQLEGASLLQCFVHLPAQVPDAAVPELVRLAALLNTRLPLVGFGYLEAERMACFRHVLMLPRDPAPAEALVVQTTWIVSYLLDVFGGAVEAVAAGERSLRDALSGHPFQGLFPS